MQEICTWVGGTLVCRLKWIIQAAQSTPIPPLLGYFSSISTFLRAQDRCTDNGAWDARIGVVESLESVEWGRGWEPRRASGLVSGSVKQESMAVDD